MRPRPRRDGKRANQGSVIPNANVRPARSMARMNKEPDRRLIGVGEVAKLLSENGNSLEICVECGRSYRTLYMMREGDGWVCFPSCNENELKDPLRR